MIEYVNLKNYRSFKDVEFNLLDETGEPKNLAVIFGENGVGKTNLVSSFFVLSKSFRTMDIHDIMQPILTRSERIDNERISCLLNSGYKDIKTLIQENKKIGSEESMYLEFRFRLKDTSGRQKSGRYILETDNTQIIYEHLEFVLSKNLGTYFSITPTNTIINPKIFLEKTAYQSLQEACNKYWGKHSLLAILLHEIKDKADTYIKNQLSENSKTVLNFLLNISCKTSRGKHQQNMLGLPPEVLSELEEGNISVYKENILNRTENILNVFLKNIDTDIQKVYYEKSVAGMFIRYKLMVCRRINEVNRELPFSLESTGIQFMIQLLPFILNLQKGAVVIIDAFDIALCDDFVKKLIIFLRENLNGQLIITTCNKLVTKIDIPQENIYFLYENHVKVHRIL